LDFNECSGFTLMGIEELTASIIAFCYLLKQTAIQPPITVGHIQEVLSP
jgi:hypothetical protein